MPEHRWIKIETEARDGAVYLRNDRWPRYIGFTSELRRLADDDYIRFTHDPDGHVCTIRFRFSNGTATYRVLSFSPDLDTLGNAEPEGVYDCQLVAGYRTREVA